jgi:hypothetical protein
LIKYNFQKHHCFHTCFFPTHVRIHNCFVIDFSLQFPSSPLVLPQFHKTQLVLPLLFFPHSTNHNWLDNLFYFTIACNAIGRRIGFFFPFHKAQFLEQLVFIQPKFVNCLSPMLARWHLPRQSKKSAYSFSFPRK